MTKIEIVAGYVVVTQGIRAIADKTDILDHLARHQSGDWGCVCAEDRESNDDAVRNGGRILSAYPIDPALPCKGYGDNCVWIITEADRSVTTLLLPDEY